MIGSIAATKAAIFSSLSTISMMSGRSCERRRILVLCSTLEWPKPMGPCSTVVPARSISRALEQDGLLEGLVAGLVVLADEDADQHGVTREGHGQVHFMALIDNARTCPSHTANRHSTTEPTMLPPARSHSLSLTRLSDCR